MSDMVGGSVKQLTPAPHALVIALCGLFAILYGIWVLPHTVFVRNFCLIVGAILSFFVIIPNGRVLLQKRALPIGMILLLLLWVSFHLLFIGTDFEAQSNEYTKIWKKIAISIPFGVGLGLALLGHVGESQKTKLYWKIIFLGLLLPMIIYFIKWAVMLGSHKFGFKVPIHLALDPDHMGSAFGISRAWYVFFCMPAVSISIGMITWHIKNKTFSVINCLAYLLCLPATFAIFYLENDRLGTFFGFALIAVAMFTIGRRVIFGGSLFRLATFILVTSLSFLVLWGSFKQNPQWQSLVADAKVAITQVDQQDNWRYNRIQLKGYPLNEFAQPVSPSNYERISWAIVGSRFVPEHPLGYGLLSLSFGRLCKERWPDSEMSWSHSAWLDFTLGYGIPGFLLLAGALLLVWRNSAQTPPPWFLIGRWGLPILSAVFLVKEISSEVFINAFIFLIVFCATLSLSSKPSADDGVR